MPLDRGGATNREEGGFTQPPADAAGDMTPDGTQFHQQRPQQRGGGGALGVPGRIISTLQRKFWDSNKVCVCI